MALQKQQKTNNKCILHPIYLFNVYIVLYSIVGASLAFSQGYPAVGWVA